MFATHESYSNQQDENFYHVLNGPTNVDDPGQGTAELAPPSEQCEWKKAQLEPI